MKTNPKVSCAVVAILGAHAIAAWADQQATPAAQATPPTSAEAAGGLTEVIVTAQRREENIQNVPITIQALTNETLAQLNVQNFDQFIKYLPNVSQSTNGPSQGEVYMRGLSVGGGGNQGGGTTGAFPSVAIYLDEQPAMLPGRNLDVYAADLERIEVLEGPQGTLFGGGALAGVLRYITNKPKLNVTEGSVDATYGVTAHGDPNASAIGMINLPIVSDHLAFRAVIYTDRRGGYIDNVPSTFTRQDTDEGFAHHKNPYAVPADSEVINNYNQIANNINPVTYTGIRGELRWKINDDWDALLTQTYQNMESQGVFYEMPYSSEGTTFDSLGKPIGSIPLPPLSVNIYNPSHNKDKFENTALVVNGAIGPVHLVYAGSYLVRNVDQVQDYTNYARGVYGYYYQCTGYSHDFVTRPGKCYTPSTVWTENETNKHLAQELRASTPNDWRIRGTLGVYWEDYQIIDQTFWKYTTVPICSPTGLNVDCFLPIKPWPGSPAFTPVPEIGFFDDVKRQLQQLAEFASADFDIIPHVLTITGGIRHYHYEDSEQGGDVGSFYCKQFAPTTYFGYCQSPYGTNVSLRSPNETHYDGNKVRGTLSWQITPDHLVYYTFSQGFRAGYFNRSTSCHLPDANGISQYCVPAFTVPDNVTNNEVGWKTEWFDHRLLFNGAVYQEDWTNAQTGFFDPQGGLGNLAFATNGPTYRVRGIEPQIVARVTQGLTVQLSAAWNSSEQTNSPYLVNNNPASPTHGQPITSIPNPYGPLGSPTAYSPPFAGNARIRYEWAFAGDYTGFVQAGAQHQAHMVTATGYVPAYDIPAYTTYDAAAGVTRGPWDVQVFSQNFTNVTSSITTESSQFVLQEFPLRPRIIGVKFGYKFSEK